MLSKLGHFGRAVKFNEMVGGEIAGWPAAMLLKPARSGFPCTTRPRTFLPIYAPALDPPRLGDSPANDKTGQIICYESA